jgi:ubiquinone/menaquinone biosynthesis C-methylase UbiE
MEHTNSTASTAEEYWDEVAEEVAPVGTPYIFSNIFKRPKQLKLLLEYDFFDKKVVEIGVGLGILPFCLKVCYGRRFDYIGTDISSKFIAATKHHYDLDIIKTSADKLPVGDGEADFIIAMDALEHIHPDSRPAVAAEFKRVLKPLKGRLLINNPLSSTQHDLRFDFEFSDVEIAIFAEQMKGRIERLTVYAVNGRYYQFISIVREED